MRLRLEDSNKMLPTWDAKLNNSYIKLSHKRNSAPSCGWTGEGGTL